VALTLTGEGERAASEISQAARSYLRALLGHLTPAEMEELSRILGRLVTAADDMAAAPVS
jgi:hypothetical protein